MITKKIKSTQAEVRLRNSRVGLLIKKNDKAFLFQYDPQYIENKGALPIATNFPLEKKEFLSVNLHPFFDNLIMEGWLLHQTEKSFHIDKKNRWGLLMISGANPIGAVTIHALDELDQIIIDDSNLQVENTNLYSIEIPSNQGVCSFCLNEITGSNFYHTSCYKKLWGTSKALYIRLNEENPIQTFSKTIHNGSISGAQRKGLFALDKNELRVNSVQSLFILKPEGDFPELPANEHLTMTAAKHLNFEVPPTGIIHIENIGYVFVIKRFDRTSTNIKLMTEDMAQIHEEASEDKYSLSHEKVSEAILKYTMAGPLNLNDYFRRILFCYLIANGDMHLKNWALLELEKTPGVYKLSPVFDWLNTRIALSREKDDLAIPLGGKQRSMQKKYFQRFAIETLNLNKNYVDSIFLEIPHWIKTLETLIPRSFLSAKMKKMYLQTLKQRETIFLVCWFFFSMSRF
jgi:serine/threonine-protein kinase HipA